MDKEKILTWPGWKRERLIGKGSFGSVYEISRHDELGTSQTAALKIITIPQSQDELETFWDDGMDEESVTNYFKSYVSEVVAEFNLMSKLKGNSNIVSYEDHMIVEHKDEIGWDILIRMELLDALPKYLRNNSLEISDIIQLGIDICKALEICNQKNIIHRDIKPENIFISQYGTYKLGDFGIAKTIEKTMGGTKIGTYKYMAPEVYNNKPYGSSVDIYSLGLVLYWLLNEKRLPFVPLPPNTPTSSQINEALSSRFSGKELPAPKNGSAKLKTVVLKACAFLPKDRYISAKAFREELEQIAYEIKKEMGLVEVPPTIEKEEQLTEEPQLLKKKLVEESVIIEEKPTEKQISTEEKLTEKPSEARKKDLFKYVIGIVIGIVIISTLGLYLLSRNPKDDNYIKEYPSEVDMTYDCLELLKVQEFDGSVLGLIVSEKEKEGEDFLVTGTLQTTISNEDVDYSVSLVYEKNNGIWKLNIEKSELKKD